MDVRPALAIARFQLLEAGRTRQAWLVAALALTGALLAEFAAGLALTGSARYRLEIYAAFTRLALVAWVMLSVAASVARETQARGLDMTLSRPVSRGAWWQGRLLGHAAVVSLAAALASLPLFAQAAPASVLAWGLSLALELMLVAAATLCCALAFAQTAAAVLAVSAFYLLARSVDAMVLMSTGPAVDPSALGSAVVAKGVALLALLLPALARFTPTAWLLDDGAALSSLPTVTLQALVYLALLAAVGWFDLVRREL
ncbi:MAG: ABC transporter permease [Gammaproteobacteria bacterium]|nr:ABC transporter permease [Gammaproteobacteria bacterium]